MGGGDDTQGRIPEESVLQPRLKIDKRHALPLPPQARGRSQRGMRSLSPPARPRSTGDRVPATRPAAASRPRPALPPVYALSLRTPGPNSRSHWPAAASVSARRSRGKGYSGTRRASARRKEAEAGPPEARVGRWRRPAGPGHLETRPASGAPVRAPSPACAPAPQCPRALFAAAPAPVGEPPSVFRSHVHVHGHGGHRAHSPSRAPTRGGEPGRGRGGGTRRDGAAARGVPGRAKFQRQRQRGGDSLLLSSPALTTILLVQEMTWKTEESGVWGRRGPPNSGGRSRASLSPASPEPAPRGSSRVPAARPTGRATLRRRSGLRQLCAWDTFWGSC